MEKIFPSLLSTPSEKHLHLLKNLFVFIVRALIFVYPLLISDAAGRADARGCARHWFCAHSGILGIALDGYLYGEWLQVDSA